MKKQTITIEVPEGKVAVWENGNISFKDEPLPKTWREFCNCHSFRKYFCIGTKSEIRVFGGSVCIEELYNIQSSDLISRQFMALMRLILLRDYYRKGWIPNWTDDSDKWCIQNEKNKLLIDTLYNTNCVLSFPTSDIAEQFLTNFEELIKQAGDLI